MSFKFLRVGIAAIDAEHIILNGFVDALQTLIESNDITAPSTADGLINYFNRHASDEEVFMLSIGYHGRKDHAVAHVKLLKDIGIILKNNPLTFTDLSEAVNLIENHIATHDKAIAKYLYGIK
jgi:hemerythrin-like metal-binding protein